MPADSSTGADATGDANAAAVLLVDDDSKNLLALESVLDGSGLKLIKAQTAAEALLALMDGDFTAIVLDVSTGRKVSAGVVRSRSR